MSRDGYYRDKPLSRTVLNRNQESGGFPASNTDLTGKAKRSNCYPEKPSYIDGMEIPGEISDAEPGRSGILESERLRLVAFLR
jgi:hypothetical protein